MTSKVKPNSNFIKQIRSFEKYLFLTENRLLESFHKLNFENSRSISHNVELYDPEIVVKSNLEEATVKTQLAEYILKQYLNLHLKYNIGMHDMRVLLLINIINRDSKKKYFPMSIDFANLKKRTLIHYFGFDTILLNINSKNSYHYKKVLSKLIKKKILYSEGRGIGGKTKYSFTLEFIKSIECTRRPAVDGDDLPYPISNLFWVTPPHCHEAMVIPLIVYHAALGNILHCNILQKQFNALYQKCIDHSRNCSKYSSEQLAEKIDEAKKTFEQNLFVKNLSTTREVVQRSGKFS